MPKLDAKNLNILISWLILKLYMPNKIQFTITMTIKYCVPIFPQSRNYTFDYIKYWKQHEYTAKKLVYP